MKKLTLIGILTILFGFNCFGEIVKCDIPEECPNIESFFSIDNEKETDKFLKSFRKKSFDVPDFDKDCINVEYKALVIFYKEFEWYSFGKVFGELAVTREGYVEYYMLYR